MIHFLDEPLTPARNRLQTIINKPIIRKIDSIRSPDRTQSSRNVINPIKFNTQIAKQPSVTLKPQKIPMPIFELLDPDFP